MLTAIGLCVFIMVMQLVPQFSDGGLSRMPRDHGHHHRRRSISLWALVRPPGNAHLGARLRVPPMMSSDNVQALPPGTRLGDYRLDAVIGHGGFGITYRAFDTQLAKFVAIKEYLPVEFAVRRRRRPGGAARHALRRGFRLGPRALPRRGARARPLPPSAHRAGAALLRGQRHGLHRHGVRGRQERGASCCASRPAACRPTTCGAWPTGCSAACSAVHAQGFLHRDIKPSNIIIRRDGVPVLIDFGAARQAMGERTRTLTGMLTPQYAPIEQYALDGKQGPWSDIYSAAAVLHHAIAGQPPPDAAARVGTDPYRPLAATQADRFEPALPWRDRSRAGLRAGRPAADRRGMGAPCSARRSPRVADAPTQRLRQRVRRDAAPGRRQPRSRSVGAAAAAGAPRRARRRSGSSSC